MKYLLLFLFMIVNIHAEDTINYNMSVSDGTYNNKVDLKWDPIPNVEYYTVQRVYNTPKSTKLGKEVLLETNTIVSNTTSTQFTDNAIPFGEHLYIVSAIKTNIIPVEESKRQLKKRLNQSEKTGITIPAPLETNLIPIAIMTDTGHRQVNDQEFFLEFQKTIDSSLPRIRTMKMLNFFGEKKKGWKEGQLIYKTTGIIRKPFKVMIEYEDFVDQSLSLNGTYEVQIFKLFAQDGKLIGTFEVDGVYKGTVTHNLIIEGGQAIGGTYDVQQVGKPMVSLPWNVTTHPLDDSQYEDALKTSLKSTEIEK